MLRRAYIPEDGAYLVPEDFLPRAQEAIATFPDEWDRLFIWPQFDLDEDMRPVAYAGAAVMFERGDKYTGFMTERPQDLLEESIREARIEQVRDAFGREPLAT